MDEWTYSKAGVDVDEESSAIKAIANQLKKTFKNRPDLVMQDIGTFANLIDLGDKALAMATDGVGTKVLVAEKLGKYDTVGIDMIAMNVNDLICLGAEPIAMVDYLAVRKPSVKLLDEIGKGLAKGAEEANIAIIGGETASLPELIQGGNNSFDLAGTCIGLVDKDEIVTGESIQEGDVLVGLRSSGIHSNGLTLARKVLDMEDEENLKELLTPTKIYVKPVLELLKQVKVRGLANITGGGLENLKRLNKDIGFQIDTWTEPHPIFKKIQEAGNVPDQEMYRTFNMGIGFCVVVSEQDVNKTIEILKSEEPLVLGKAIPVNKIIKGDLEY